MLEKIKKRKIWKRSFNIVILIILTVFISYSSGITDYINVNKESLRGGLIGGIIGSAFGPAGALIGGAIGYSIGNVPDTYSLGFIVAIIIIGVGTAVGAIGGAIFAPDRCDLYEPPGENYECSTCNNDPIVPCTEYRCESIGQLCAFQPGNEANDARCFKLTREGGKPYVTGCEAFSLNLDMTQAIPNPVETSVYGETPFVYGVETPPLNLPDWAYERRSVVNEDVDNGEMGRGRTTRAPIAKVLGIDSITGRTVNGAVTDCNLRYPLIQYNNRIALKIETDQEAICRFSDIEVEMFNPENREYTFEFGYKPDSYKKEHYFVLGFGALGQIVDIEREIQEKCFVGSAISRTSTAPCQVYVQCKGLNEQVMDYRLAVKYPVILSPDTNGPQILIDDELRNGKLPVGETSIRFLDIQAYDDSGIEGCKVFKDSNPGYDGGGISLELSEGYYILPDASPINVGDSPSADLYFVCRDKAVPYNDNFEKVTITRSAPEIFNPRGEYSDEVNTIGETVGCDCSSTCRASYRSKVQGTDTWSDWTTGDTDLVGTGNGRVWDLNLDFLQDGNTYDIGLKCIGDNDGEEYTFTRAINRYPITINNFLVNEVGADKQKLKATLTTTGGTPAGQVDCTVFTSRARENVEGITELANDTPIPTLPKTDRVAPGAVVPIPILPIV